MVGWLVGWLVVVGDGGGGAAIVVVSWVKLLLLLLFWGVVTPSSSSVGVRMFCECECGVLGRRGGVGGVRYIYRHYFVLFST